MMIRKSLAILMVVLLSGLWVTSFAQKKREVGLSKQYKEWLDKDVAYIISEEEKRFFKDLKNDEERENFIQQFWERRNPDPRSSYNAFKEEHYRRIAYANQQFASGVPGWRTDRGRIYILYGAPDDREIHATGGTYYRPYREGGGVTSRFPWEKWFYRYIEGVCHSCELLFVDSSISNEYHLAIYPDEADALINVPGAGLTLAEEMGLADKLDRAYYNPSGWYDYNNAQNMGASPYDSPFARMDQYFSVQRPPSIKFNDLKAMVTTSITYSLLPFDVRTDFIKLSGDKVLVPISIEISNAELGYKKDKEFNRATVNVYGIVTGLTNKIHAEWEDVVAVDANDLYFDYVKKNRSTYQRIVALPPGQRYKLDLVLKDVNSKKVGTMSMPLIVPKYEDAGLQASSIILANHIAEAPKNATTLDQYIIGDWRIKPNIRAIYNPGQNLIPYMQIYGMDVDQSTQRPSLEVEFLIKKDGETLETIQNSAMNTTQFYLGRRVELIGKIPVGKLPPGKYQFEIRVLDKISTKRVTATREFIVNEPTPTIERAAAEEAEEKD